MIAGVSHARQSQQKFDTSDCMHSISQQAIGSAVGQRMSTQVRLGALCLLASGVGIAAWMNWAQPLMLCWLLAMPMLVFRALNRVEAFMVAFCYYAVGAKSVPEIILYFFPNLSVFTSLLIWASSAALLAVPWAIAFAPLHAGSIRRTAGVISALLVLSLPPIGLFHWGSPLMVSGLLYPGLGWIGLAFTVVLLALIAISNVRANKVHIAIGLAAFLAAGTNVLYHEPLPPEDWRAISLESGKNPELWSDEMIAKRLKLGELALAEMSRGAKVVIFPEASSGSSRRSQMALWTRVASEAKLRGATVLVGEETWNASRTSFKNALIGFGSEKDGGAVVVSSMVPMPIGDWKFGLEPGAETNVFGTDLVELHGKRVAFSICYEDFLLWPHRGLLTGHADLFVSSTNQWPSRGTSAEVIQDVSRAALARMAGVPLLTAKNR